jgi:2-oxoglutarate ferredoxin oxidoreductase subunit beta
MINPLVYTSLSQALDQLEYQRQRLVVITDLNYIDPGLGSSINAPHGQTIAVAMGVAAANPALKIIIVTSEDNLLSQTANLLLVCQSNYHLMIVVVSASSAKRVLNVALISQATYIARGFAGDPAQLQQLFKSSIKHFGLSIINILQPDATQKKTYAWYRQNLKPLPPTWLTNDQAKAQAAINDEMQTGVMYQRKASTFQSQLLKQMDKPLVDQSLKNPNLKSILAKYK